MSLLGEATQTLIFEGVKSYESNLKQNASTERSGSSSLNIYIYQNVENWGNTWQTHEIISPKNQEILEFGGFGPSHNKIEILLNPNEAE